MTADHFEPHQHGFRRVCRECRNAARRTGAPKGPHVTPALGRFLAMVDKRGPDECWPWMGGLSSNGLYGVFHPETGVTVLAHRWYNEQIFGPIPLGFNVNHVCDFGRCQNTGHHWRGTQRQNVHDCRSKGRNDRKLEIDQVLDARRECSELGTPYTIIAARYGVTPGCIQHSVTGRTWAHI
jgi:hypothetical protein